MPLVEIASSRTFRDIYELKWKAVLKMRKISTHGNISDRRGFVSCKVSTDQVRGFS